jgi:Rod binding domain-containing protein
MIVDAVAEAVAKGGGLGLADVMARAMDEKVQSATPGVLADAQKTPQVAPPEMHEALLAGANTELGKMPSKTPPGSRPVTLNDPLLGDVRISPQGLSPTAVPRTEIRASAAPIKGPLADRRIR